MEQVFVNRTLDMKRIKWLGFDMDHTLIRYHIEAFEQVSHELICKGLVEWRGYPGSIIERRFEPHRIIRGLVVDRRQGNLLKLNLYGRIRSAYHGTKRLSFEQVRNLYHGSLLDLNDDNFAFVDTSYSLSTACLFSQLVQLKDGGLELPEYERIHADILECCDRIHLNGPLKKRVMTQPERFLKRNEALIQQLYAYRDAGKRLFLATNSGLTYTRALFEYAIEPFLRDEQAPLFEFVITASRKPSFFYQHNPLKDEHGLPASELKGFLEGGSAQFISEKLEVRPDEILYIGDHIYGDIVKLKKSCAWRTALVIDEMDAEIRGLRQARPIQTQIDRLMQEKIPLEKQLHHRSGETKPLWGRIRAIDAELGSLIRAYQGCFNPYWGELMRVGVEESFFAGQVARYACIYAGTLTEILSNPPLTYFRPRRRLLPHDLALGSDEAVT